MTTTERFWALGASDPERLAIEGLLQRCGERYAVARYQGRDVNPESAYYADWPKLATHWVECQVPGIERCWLADHHNDGDPGVGQPAENYFQASSVGQVFLYLSRIYQNLEADVNMENLRYVAAADHCLRWAYAGQCPGIDPELLYRRRVKQKADWQGCGEDEVMHRIENAMHAIQQARGDRDWALLWTPWPELPEAAARSGINTVARLPSGKWTLLGEPEFLRRVLAGEMEELPKWSRIYGDPHRGICGAWEKREREVDHG